MKIYFDNVLIDENAYAGLENTYKLFNDNFYLGSTASNTFKITIAKTAVSSHPSEVKITDDTNTYYLIVDKVTEEKNFYIYDLVDKLVLLNYNYDASTLINTGDTYLSDILEDMCSTVGIAIDSSLTLINNIQVTWYDNTIQAREYLSYIAELQGGFVRFNNSGELSIVGHNMSSQATLNTGDVEEFIKSEEKTISKVVFDNGLVYWAVGDDTGNTLYLDPNNVYIVNEDIIENIFNRVNGLNFWIGSITKCTLPNNIRAGDIITILDGVTPYNIIVGYTSSYTDVNQIAMITNDVQTKQQDATPLADLSQKVRSLKVDLNRAENELSIVASEVDGNTQNIATLTESVNGVVIKVEEIDGIKEDVAEISAQIDGLEVNVVSSGGNNLIQNSVGLFTGDWDISHSSYTDTEIKNNSISKNAWLLQNLTSEQIIQVQNGIYTLSGKYKKLITLADCKISINGYETELTEEVWSTFTYTFEVLSNTITIDLISDTDDSCYVTDLMLNLGSLPQIWTPANGESIKGNVKIGNVIIVSSDTSNTRTIMDTDGNRIENASTGEVIAEYTDKGMNTKEIEAESGTIANLLIMDVGNQTWLSRL